MDPLPIEAGGSLDCVRYTIKEYINEKAKYTGGLAFKANPLV
jgi:hypothetical protein